MPEQNYIASENSDVLTTEAWVFMEFIDLDFHLNGYSSIA